MYTFRVKIVLTNVHNGCIMVSYTKVNGGEKVARKENKILKELRGKRSCKEIANALDISESAYVKYERGERTPRDSTKKKIADFFGKSVESIFFAQMST